MLLRKTNILLSALVLFLAASVPVFAAYNESGGLVIMEMENTQSALGLWQARNGPLTGYTGSGYLEFTGNKTTNGPPQSPLVFKFVINKAGLYYLHLHCARDTTHGQPADHSNDCYVRVDGDYGAGPNAGDSHGDDAPLSTLKSDTKFFGGCADSFCWASGNRLDLGGHNNKRVAVYDFKAGQTYTLVVHGRSKWFSVNRIVFRHKDTAKSVAQNLGAPESTNGGGGGGGGGGGDTTSPPTGDPSDPKTPTGPTSESYKVYQRVYGNPTGRYFSKSHEVYQKRRLHETNKEVSKSYEAYQRAYGDPTGEFVSESYKAYRRRIPGASAVNP